MLTWLAIKRNAVMNILYSRSDIEKQNCFIINLKTETLLNCHPPKWLIKLHCCQQWKAHAFSILIPKYFYQIKCFYNNLSEICYLILNFSDNCWSLASFYIEFVTILFSVNIFLIMLKIQKPCHHYKLSSLTALL